MMPLPALLQCEQWPMIVIMGPSKQAWQGVVRVRREAVDYKQVHR